LVHPARRSDDGVVGEPDNAATPADPAQQLHLIAAEAEVLVVADAQAGGHPRLTRPLPLVDGEEQQQEHDRSAIPGAAGLKRTEAAAAQRSRS